MTLGVDAKTWKKAASRLNNERLGDEASAPSSAGALTLILRKPETL
jgi:hypothetical protein